MNQSGKCPAVAKAYKQKLEEIHISLQPFEKKSGGGGGCGDGSSAASTVSTLSTTSGVSSLSSGSNGLATPQQQDQYAEDMSTAFRALKHGGPSVNGRFEDALQFLSMSPSGYESSKGGGGKQLIRKPSLERELSGLRSPALDSGAGSSRSDSPHPPAARQYSPSGFGDPPPPPPPPRCSQSSTPPPPPPHVPYPPPNVQQLLKRMSPAPVVPQRGTSPVTTAGTASSAQRLGHQPMVVQNGFQAQQQLSQQIQALSMYQSGGGGSAGGGSVVSAGSSSAELPPPYPLGPPQPPPSYSSIYQSRQSPTQSQVSDYRKSPSSGVYSGPGSPSPVTTAVSSSPMVRPTPLQAWGARQAKTQPPIIMQSVKSTQVQKPVLQTAVAPTAPVTPVAQPPPPSYATSIQQKQQQHVPKPPTPVIPTASVPTTEPPSYATTMQALAAQRSHLPPPPPYGQPVDDAHHLRKCSIETIRSDSPPTPEIREAPLPPSGKQQIVNGTDGRPALPHKKIRHQSPIPERKHISKEKEDERRDCKVQNYSPQAFKFFMEQHIENVLKSYKQRVIRRVQLETEMAKIGLSLEAQCQMRKMLSQKESNYIRLKRAKMDKSMFTKIKPIGVGAFGEVTLVKKIDTNHLYAMKTLRKADVLKRNQVAHVKAERDILAEADNEWVVKLYYSFQDKDNLYFVMDYIPGGDLMSLLIKKGIFEESLARFYIAELTCAVESVHKMGFIHRDIKPDNILIDRDGHIKLTDFGLCTGFRWTHNSKYYQQNGEHNRQDSMEPMDALEDWSTGGECRCHQLKPLERRRRREHQRCLAHSLVGTPNYIAPEVLQRIGYTQLCDWWSVGVILYEMLVGSPPFLANTPAETQYKVINWETTLHIPIQANLSKESKDLILKLCVGADKRIGKNANEVKAHPFFKNIDFDKGLRTQIAPYIPRIDFPTDTSNFDPVDPDKLRNSLSNDKSNDDFLDTYKPFHGFFEFTFRRFFDDGGGPAFANKITLDDNENQGPVYV